MKHDLEQLRSFSERCVAREFAEFTSEIYFRGTEPTFPIDIFKILSDFGIRYQFLELQNIEGLYSPEKDGLVAVVGINSRRPYERQRFTAAHELCHHLKDYNRTSFSPIGSDDPIEKYANTFAAALLMPWRYFLKEIEKIENSEGFVEPENALYLCQIFGVSFESVIWNLRYYNKINFEPNESFFRDFGPNRRMGTLGLEKLNGRYLRNIIDSYTYIPQTETSPLWIRLKTELIYNDNRVEGLQISKEQVAEICTDLRLKRYESKYYEQFSDKKEIVETVGHSLVYDFISITDENPDRFKAKDLVRTLFSLAPHGFLMGEYRQTNNLITGAFIETMDYQLIEREMYYVDQQIDDYITNLKSFSFSEALEKAAIIHHRITQIHPFTDGNGRISRAILNWLLKLRKLPPVFVDNKDKYIYIDAMQKADQFDLSSLYEFFLQRLLYSMIHLNNKLSLSVAEQNAEHFVG